MRGWILNQAQWFDKLDVYRAIHIEKKIFVARESSVDRDLITTEGKCTIKAEKEQRFEKSLDEACRRQILRGWGL